MQGSCCRCCNVQGATLLQVYQTSPAPGICGALFILAPLALQLPEVAVAL